MARIERHWARATPLSVLLYPASLVYGGLIYARRAAYRAGVARAERLPVPVIVVGNLTVGGTGKTPLVLWLAQFLRAHGRAPGILCRGYGGTLRSPRHVAPDADALECGDEPVLLAQRSGCPVWIGADRAAAARALLATRPACDVLLCDDGLQHYALARDVEICVVDAARGFGNGWLLPAGPLREPLSRLAQVDALVVNGTAAPPPAGQAPCFAMRLEGREFRNALDPSCRTGPEGFRGKRVHAIAGIGNPQRFFDHLRALGLEVTPHIFPDHHPFAASDLALPGAEALVMTEKDAVKCRRFAAAWHWVLPVDAVPDPALGEYVLHRLAAVHRG
jgi:tetraacyldisaccharide 4'-kinase